MFMELVHSWTISFSFLPENRLSGPEHFMSVSELFPFAPDNQWYSLTLRGSRGVSARCVCWVLVFVPMWALSVIYLLPMEVRGQVGERGGWGLGELHADQTGVSKPIFWEKIKLFQNMVCLTVYLALTTVFFFFFFFLHVM